MPKVVILCPVSALQFYAPGFFSQVFFVAV
jgi:hypothetical protein